MKWDFTITVGNILTAVSICGTLAASAIAVVRRLDRFIEMMKHFPPHRHVGNKIQYPKGYELGLVEELGEKKA